MSFILFGILKRNDGFGLQNGKVCWQEKLQSPKTEGET